MAVKRYPEDKAFSEAIRESYDYTCAKCSTNYRHQPGYMDCAHVHTRLHRATRWNSDYGAVALCKPCHQRFTKFPLEWADFLRKDFGDDWYEAAKQKSWSIAKYTKAEKKEIAKHYREESKRIQFLRSQGEQGYIRLVSYD